MNPEQRNFFRQLLHNALHAAINSVMWRLPLGWLLIVMVILIGVVMYLGW
jgi:hypothetical protein